MFTPPLEAVAGAQQERRGGEAERWKEERVKSLRGHKRWGGRFIVVKEVNGSKGDE